MIKAKYILFLLTLFIFFQSCSGPTNLKDITFKDDQAFLNDEPYSGEAVEFYSDENTKRVITSFEEGLTTKKLFYSEDGDLTSEEIFSANELSIKNSFLNGEVLVTQDFINESIKVEDIVCEEECIYEGVTIENVTLTGATFTNVTFKNSKFINVTLQGTRGRDENLLNFNNVKIIDSDFQNLIIGTYVNFGDKGLSLNSVTGSILLNIESKGYDNDDKLNLKINNSDLDNLFVLNTNKNLGSEELYLSVNNSIVNEFFFVSFNERLSNPVLSLKNSTIKMLNGLHIGSLRGKSEGEFFNCENTSFEKSENLAFVIDACDDMGEEFDEFALKEFEKSYYPDNSLALLSDYAQQKQPYQDFTVWNEGDFNEEKNQKYAIASGDDEFLERYLKSIYTIQLNSARMKGYSSCDDSNLLSLARSCNGNREQNYMSLSNFVYWLQLPDEFRSPIADDQKNLLLTMLDSYDTGQSWYRLNSKYYEQFVSTNEDRKTAVEAYYKKYHDFSGLNNCLRGKENKEAVKSLQAVSFIESSTNDYSDRIYRLRSLLNNQLASEDSNIPSFKECIEGNITKYSTQVLNAYNPINKIIEIHEEEYYSYQDEENRKKELAKKQRQAERNKLFETFIEKSPAARQCDSIMSGDGGQLINMFFSGTPEAKAARVDRALKSCQRCYFNVFSNILTNDEFTNFVNGQTSFESAKGRMTMEDGRKILMCPVSGADYKVQDMYRKNLGL